MTPKEKEQYLSWQGYDGLEYYCSYDGDAFRYGKQSFEPTICHQCSEHTGNLVIEQVRKLIVNRAISDIVPMIKFFIKE